MEKVYQDRQKRLKEEMKAKGLSKALITNPNSVFYFTGAFIIPLERFLGFILDVAEESGYLVMPVFEAGRIRDGLTQEVPFADTQDPLSLASEVLGAAKQVGLEKQHLSLFRAEGLLSKQAYQWVDIEPIIMRMRLLKDEREIQCMQKAAEYTDQLLMDMKVFMKPGVTENQFKGELIKAINQNPNLMGPAFGAQVSSGVHASVAHGLEGDRAFQKGESLIIDVGVIYEHYLCDMTRTYFIGQPDSKLKEMYHVVEEANRAGVEAVEPGIPMARVDNAARNVIEKAGYGQYFTTRVGHGLGLEVHEPPSVHNLNQDLLEVGMVFSVEPGIYIPNFGGIRIEDDVLVTKDGRLSITKHPRTLENAIVSE